MIKSVRARHQAGMRFAIRTGSGHSLAIDEAEGDSAARRAELLLAAQAGCTALDVASVLARKRPSFASYEVRYVLSRGDGRPDEGGEVVVTGLGGDPDALGERRLAAAGTPAGAAR